MTPPPPGWLNAAEPGNVDKVRTDNVALAFPRPWFTTASKQGTISGPAGGSSAYARELQYEFPPAAHIRTARPSAAPHR